MKTVVLTEADLKKEIFRKRFDQWELRNKELIAQLSYAAGSDANFVIWQEAISDFIDYCRARRDDMRTSA